MYNWNWLEIIYKKGVLFIDKESISRLGLDYIANIDVESSDEIYDPSTTNHIIVLKLIKQSNVWCPHCGLVLHDPIIRSSIPLFWLTEKIKRNNKKIYMISSKKGVLILILQN